MALSVLVAPDKFKGTLCASQAARAMAAGWRRARPADRIECLPMSDGGDGFGELLGLQLGADRRWVETVNAHGRRCRVAWWWYERSGRPAAIVESARVIGLAMLPRGRFHPFQLDTYGLGEVLVAVAAQGIATCVVGIGGSATNDAGFGLARALGWRFFDSSGFEILNWTGLEDVARVVPPRRARLGRMRLTVAVDVRNRLLGKTGATRVYGPQKGIRPVDVPVAERAIRALLKAHPSAAARRVAGEAGSGAAGGLGFGLAAFAGARLEPGSVVFARHTNLRSRLAAADLVLTGEGALDRSTLMGKGVGEIGRWCRELGIPCLALGGIASDRKSLGTRFDQVCAMAPDLVEFAQATSDPARWLAALSFRAARAYGSDNA